MADHQLPEALRHLAVPIASLRPYPNNPRQGDVGAIAQSLRAHNQYRPVVVRRADNTVLAGNHTLAAAKALGWQEIAATFVDVDDDEAARIVIVDNRTSDLASNDPEKLAALLQELAARPAGLEGSGYDGDALDELLADLGQMGPEAQGDPDAVPEVPADQEPITKRADIIRLGRHTLGCIDSTNVDEVRRLLCGVTADMVWTDPPYGINIVQDHAPRSHAQLPYGGLRGTVGAPKPFGSKAKGQVGWGQPGPKKIIPCGLYEPVIGDESTQTAIAAYGVCATLSVPVLIFWGGNYYASALPDSSAWIVWDKENDATPFADAELAWTNQDTAVRIFRHMWNGLLKDSERGEKRIAPTQKPVALAEWCFAQYGKEGDVVLDLFGGSGTALIAAERTGRTCYMAELSEHYCDCIIARWEAATGQRAERPARDHERIPAGAGRL